jgi:AcrR family transcriptional regulator
MSKSPALPRDQRAGQKREQILDEALNLFAEKGYHGTNIADIALRLNMGHGTFYRYFKNKHDIFIEVINLVLRKISVVSLNQNPRAAQTVADYREQLVGIGHTFLRLHYEDPRLGKVIFYEALGAGDEVRQTLDGAFAMTALVAQEYLKNGIKKGYLRADLDVAVTARALMAMVMEACRSVVKEADPEAASRRWMDSIIGIILGGITTQVVKA